jgi:hypothetical protein
MPNRAWIHSWRSKRSPALPGRMTWVGMAKAGHGRELGGVPFALRVELLAEQDGRCSAAYEGRCGLPSGITNSQR